MVEDFWKVVNTVLTKHHFYSLFYKQEAVVNRQHVITRNRDVDPCLLCFDRYPLSTVFTDKLATYFDRSITIYDYITDKGIKLVRVVPSGSYEKEDALVTELNDYFKTVKLEDVPPLKGK